jgi:hypothetical protein
MKKPNRRILYLYLIDNTYAVIVKHIPQHTMGRKQVRTYYTNEIVTCKQHNEKTEIRKQLPANTGFASAG